MPVSKLETTVENVKFRRVEYTADDAGRIPDQLAYVTMDILFAHLYNGDLDWVLDMVQELEEGKQSRVLTHDEPA